VAVVKQLRTAGLLAGLLAAIACDSGPLEVQWSDGLEALFIGNSITYWHDTPKIVEALTDSAGIGPNNVESFTRGGWSLRDHWQYGEARRLIEQGGWDVVVLQGSSGSQDSLLKYVRLFAERAFLGGARTALFMPNPSAENVEYADEIAATYAEVATRVDAVLLPVAVAWREVLNRDPAFDLYTDNVHPNEAGSYLAALVIFQHLTGRSAIGLPAALWVDKDWYPGMLEIPPEDAAFLQGVADAVWMQH